MISEVMSFVCSYIHKMAYERIRQITFSEFRWFQSNGLSVKYLYELVQKYGEKKSGVQEAEFRERIRKEGACLHRGGSSWVSDFSARLVFIGCRPD